MASPAPDVCAAKSEPRDCRSYVSSAMFIMLGDTILCGFVTTPAMSCLLDGIPNNYVGRPYSELSFAFYFLLFFMLFVRCWVLGELLFGYYSPAWNFSFDADLFRY